MSHIKTSSHKAISKAKGTDTYDSIMTINLPKGLKISTITITGKFKTDFNILNIGKYIDLNYDRIRSKKYNNIVYSIDKNGNITKDLGKNKKTKSNKNFYNQTTVGIISKIKAKKTMIKLFKNGSIQITGCKGYDHFLDIMKILIEELHKKKAVLVGGKIIKKEFMNKSNNVNMDKFYDFNVSLINSNFKIGYDIDREKLYNILLKQGVECRYDPILHAGVNIKYYYTDKNKKKYKISIFVFKSGSVIITGARCINHIPKAQEYICRILYDNYSELVLINFDKFIKSLAM